MTVDQVANSQLVARTGGGRLMRWRLPPTLVSLVVGGVAWEVAGRIGDATYFPPFLELTKCGADNESRRLNSAKTRRRKKMHQ